MNKKLFFLAIAALGLAACSNDDVVEINQGLEDANTISFRPVVTNVTRAADINATTLEGTGFYVSARTHTGNNPYFTDAAYTVYSNATGTKTWTSTDRNYWPSDNSALDFYAYAPQAVGEGHNSQITAHEAYNTFAVQPSATASEQVDLIFANTNEKTKSANSGGVTLNFRHTGCKVAIKLYNGNKDNIDVYVRDASICYVKDRGVFTYSDTNTDGNNSDGTGTILTASTWNVTSASPTSYTQTDASTTKYNVAVGSAAQVGQDWILIPQTFTYKTTYESTEGKPFEGPCIKVNLKILNHANQAYIVGGADNLEDENDNEGYITAMWPLMSTPTAWEIGKKYTYTVDLSGGGYYEKNTSGDDVVLDPILSGSEIKFITVTVDEWNPEGGTVYNTGL